MNHSFLFKFSFCNIQLGIGTHLVPKILQVSKKLTIQTKFIVPAKIKTKIIQYISINNHKFSQINVTNLVR